MKKLKTIIFMGSLLLSMSCGQKPLFDNHSPIGFNIQIEKKTSSTQKIKNYIAGIDTLYSLEQKCCSYTKDNQLRVGRIFMRKD